MRLKRLTTVVVAAAAVALGLAACSGGTGEGSSGGSSNGTVTLQFPSWQATEPGYEQFYKSQVAQFEKSHPNVKINFYEVTYDNFIQQMTTELSANDAPDILPLPVANYASFASDGFLTNLDSDLQGTDILSSWTPGQKSMQVNGHYYGVLMQAAGYVLYANKQLLAAKHLSAPTTMAQLLADSKALTGNGSYGIAMPTAQDPNIVSYASAFIVGNGDQLLVNNKYNLTDPKVVSDVQQYRELAQYAAPGLISEQARQIYNSGKAAFLLDGIFELPAIASASKSVYANTEMLKLPMPNQVTKLSSSLQIPATISQQHKQLAWEFIKQVTSPAAQTEFAKDTQTPAPRTSVNAAVAASIPFYSVQQASDNGLNIVPSATWFQKNYGEIGTDFGSAMTGLFTSNASAASELASLQAQLPAPRKQLTVTMTQEAAVAARRSPAPARPPRRLLPAKRTRFHLLLLTPAILLGVLVLGYPLYLVISASLKDIDILSPSLLASAPVTTQNYKELGSDPSFTQAIRNSIIYTVGSTVPAGVLGLLTALLLNQRFRFRRVFRTLILLPWAVPTVVASFLFLWVLNASYGVLNYILKQLHLVQDYIPWLASPHWALAGVIIPTVWKSYPFFCLLILAALQTIPKQLYEAAAVDGAGAWARFRAVTWPGISPAVYLATVLQALWAFREFEVIYPMTTGGPAGSTQTLAIYLYNEAFQFFHLGYASALGVVTIGFCIIFVALAYPRMRRNLSRS